MSTRPERDALIRSAKVAGYSEREIADAVGVAPSLVHRIVSAAPTTRGDRLRRAAEIALAQLDADA
jgi:transposase